jgi:hypothetical protein
MGFSFTGLAGAAVALETNPVTTAPTPIFIKSLRSIAPHFPGVSGSPVPSHTLSPGPRPTAPITRQSLFYTASTVVSNQI